MIIGEYFVDANVDYFFLPAKRFPKK